MPAALLAIAAELIAILLTNDRSAVPFLYCLLLTLLLHFLLFRQSLLEPLGLFAFYAAVVLALYFAQRISLPEYYGFSGPGHGLGTDDVYFFSLVADSLPADFPVRPDFWLREAPYTTLLRAIDPLPIFHPLDILFFNAIALTFIPVFTGRLAAEVTGQPRVARLAWILTAVGPFILLNGAILVRDGWTAAAFVGALLFFVRQRYVTAAILAALLFVLRISSGLQLLLAMSIFSLLILQQYRPTRRMLYAVVLLTAGIAVVAVSYRTLSEYVISKGLLDNPFFRLSFVEEFLALQQDRNVLILTISRQHALIRIPLSFAYFLANPFFSPQSLWFQGVFVPRAVLANVFALAFLIYLKLLTQGSIAALRNGNTGIRVTLFTFCLLLLLLAQLSLQVRHKTMIMPLMYIMVAFGYYNSSKRGREMGTLIAGGFLAVTVVNLFRLA